MHGKVFKSTLVFTMIAIVLFGGGIYFGIWVAEHPPYSATSLPASIDHAHNKVHPPRFSYNYFTEDPVTFVTLVLAVATAFLFMATMYLVTDARENSEAALEAARQNTATLIATERPYLTGGGGLAKVKLADGTFEDWSLDNPSSDNPAFIRGPVIKRFLPVDVQNNGKTPALLTHFGVEFRTIEEVKADYIDVPKQREHRDWLGAGEKKKGIDRIEIPDGKDVAFGSFWYLDFEKKEHYFRFILRIEPDKTRPNIADEVDKRYTEWT